MNPLATLFTLIASVALLTVPRRWAPLPLLLGACYMTLGQGINLGPFSFTVIRIVILVGWVRVLARGERPPGGLIGLDRIMIYWGLWGVCCSVFHSSPSSYFVTQLGQVYNILGSYFLIRAFCRDREDIENIIRITAIILIPVALEMINAKMTGKNLFSVFGGVPEAVVVRSDRLRAQGPFLHAILAGTVGAVCIPLMLGIWRIYPRTAKVGIVAGLIMVGACSSSGPVMTVLASVFGLILWRWRHSMSQLRIAAVTVIGYIFLNLVMEDSAYYLIARIDLTGGSTGWHRAYLIEQAIAHLGEWWLTGTDFTRHWMPTGVSWSTDHSDITNQYIAYGVTGGLPLMCLFIAAIFVAFRYVGRILDQGGDGDDRGDWITWTLGVCLFSHAASCVSVAYFDQSFLFLYLSLALIGSLYAATCEQARTC